MNFNKLLIIGPIPPPIGGVSIHVSRKILALKKLNFPHHFINSHEFDFFQFFKISLRAKIIHLHVSNVYIQLFFSIYSYFFSKKLVVTFHGDINRYRYFDKLVVRFVIFLCEVPILLNESSKIYALRTNLNSKLISAFIPPEKNNVSNISELKFTANNRFEKIFCTNAFRLNYDKNGIEIYQIFTLIDVFSKYPNYLLIISDPSSSYNSEIHRRGNTLPANIILISYPHDFTQVILKSHFLIRFTSTDGDSLSIREALFYNKKVIASDVVDRPEGVDLVAFNKLSLTERIRNITLTSPANSKFEDFGVDTISQLISLYHQFLN